MSDVFAPDNKKLGFGLMRLPQADPNDYTSIDYDTVNRMVDYFIEQGFTYFDTALMYCGGSSEHAVKVCLAERYPRDAYTIADKMHGGFFNTEEEMDTVFAGQLEKTGVGFFDYYLLHDIGEDHYKKYTRLHSFEWLSRKKEEGLVKHIGFSYHDGAELLDRVLTEHPEVEFVQLQLNYLDWESPAIQSRECYEVCCKHGKPVIVMEPVKGGTLANVPEEVAKLFKDYNAEASIPSWAIRFAASQPNVRMVLSGMGTMDMMRDNCSYMSDFSPLTADEQALVVKAADTINASIAIPCTGCSYCVEGCPKQIAIPKYFALYNAEKQEYAGKGWSSHGEYYDRLTENFGKASACIGCAKCEKVCPQHLPIRAYLKDVADMFEK